MRIVEHYSHLNGLEFIKVHQPRLWDEIVRVIGGIDATRLRTKVSREVRMKGKMLYSPKALNIAFDEAFRNLGWNESRTSYWVTSDARLI